MRVKRGQQIDLTGEVTRIDDETVTIAFGPLQEGVARRCGLAAVGIAVALPSSSSRQRRGEAEEMIKGIVGTQSRDPLNIPMPSG